MTWADLEATEERETAERMQRQQDLSIAVLALTGATDAMQFVDWHSRMSVLIDIAERQLRAIGTLRWRTREDEGSSDGKGGA